MSDAVLQAPFPYFGGKSRVADVVWSRFGDVPNYVEPFFGSGATLLARPTEPKTETVNDACGFITNFWRAVVADPETVARHADHPVNENDLHARHAWMVGQMESMQSRLEGYPEWFDAKVAGWWCWGMCCWIGHGFASGEGPWHVIGGELVRTDGDRGRGVNRQLVSLTDWMTALRDRLRNVRVCCGDWSRVCGPTPTTKFGLTGVFLDPPYSAEAERADVYRVESATVAHDVRRWAIEHGDDPLMRIAVCGYEGEHEFPDSWEVVAWKTGGGYANQSSRENVNGTRERIWFSPHCLRVGGGLFE